jgi:hypothetical protein
MKSFAFGIAIFLLLTACAREAETAAAPYQFKDFYYPIDDLRVGKVYVYTPVSEDTLPSYFWYFFNSGGYLVGTKYDANLQIEQIVTEDVVRNGTKLHRLQLCEYLPSDPDRCASTEVEIISSAVFPFEMLDSSSIFLNKIKWNDYSDPTIENEITRNRHFMGFDTCVWKGNRYDCAIFGIREEIQVGSAAVGYQTFRTFTEERYARGIGLVYYKKSIENTYFLEYQLADTTNMQALERMFAKQKK